MHNPTIPQDIADKALPCNGRELVAAILDHPQGGVGALLSFVGNQETEWLEFKAALYPQDGKFKEGEKKDDYRWHIAKAIIALANSLGGAVILGLDDYGQVVGIKASDPKDILISKGRDDFKRDVLQAIYLRPSGWKTSKEGTLLIESSYPIEYLVAIKEYHYKEQDLAIFLVDPIPSDEWLEVTRKRGNHQEQKGLIYVRDRGEIGRVREIQSTKDYLAYQRSRNQTLQGIEFTNLRQKFLAGLPSIDQQQRMAALEKSLMAYCQCVKQDKAFQNSWFTPLYAHERLVKEDQQKFDPETEGLLDMYPVSEPWYSWGEDFIDDKRNSNKLDDKESYGCDFELLSERVARHGSVFDLLEKERRAVLLGGPGAGKTTCLKRLAWEAAIRYQTGTVLTLFVPLIRYTPKGLRALLLKYAGNGQSSESHMIEWRDLEYLISQNRLRILLDAFNECPLHLHTQCCKDIHGLLRDYPDILLVVSSRASAYPCQLRLPTFTIRPLDQDQQQHFLASYLGDENKAAAILSHLYRQPGDDLITSTPILLRIVLEVSKKQGELPHGRALLYRQFFENWYEREQKMENNTGASLPWSLQKTREALACLAFATRREGQVSCELNRALQHLTPLLHEHSRAFLERMAQGLLLTLDEEDENLAFEHETIQEYFAGEYLVKHPDALQTLKPENHAGWLMPLAYAFELETQPDVVFIQAAWKMCPLLVAVALRDELQLRALPIDDGWEPWVKNLLHTLYHQSPASETEIVSEKPVYPPLPLTLMVRTLFE